MKKALLICCLCGAGWLGFGQTTLSSGDIAIIYVFSENTTSNADEVGLLLLTDIEAGTVFYLTDEGTNDGTTIENGTEGIIRFTASSALSAGTTIVWETGTSDSRWSDISDEPAITTSGDQVIIFQDSNTGNAVDPWEEPTFIFSGFFDGLMWDTDCGADCTSTMSEEPLSGVTFAFGNSNTTEFDNSAYNGSLTFSSPADEIGRASCRERV